LISRLALRDEGKEWKTDNMKGTKEREMSLHIAVNQYCEAESDFRQAFRDQTTLGLDKQTENRSIINPYFPAGVSAEL